MMSYRFTRKILNIGPIRNARQTLATNTAPLPGIESANVGVFCPTVTGRNAMSIPLELDAISEEEPIKFYNRSDPYYEFTNFYMASAPVAIDNKLWPTTEHYYQAQKFNYGTFYYEKILQLPSPREAFRFSRTPQAYKEVKKNWEFIKDGVMLTALRAKFLQNEDLKQLLLKTRNRKLVEHTANDSYWGDGGDGSGQNRLGELLMAVRDELFLQNEDLKQLLLKTRNRKLVEHTANDSTEEMEVAKTGWENS